MKKIALLSLFVLGFSQSAFCKILNVSCSGRDFQGNEKTLKLSSQLTNVSTPQQIQSLSINGLAQSQSRDVSTMPIYNNGVVTLKIQYGRSFYSSVSLKVQKCDDSFEATGVAHLQEYTGGFAGTSQSELKCTCDLK